MQERDGAQQLPGKGLNLGAGKGHKAARLEEIENAESQQRCDDANVASPVETVAKLNAAIAVVLVRST